MRLRALAIAVLLSLQAAWAFSDIEHTSTYNWDAPKTVNVNTVFFHEKIRPKKELSGAPEAADKSYPWYCLKKGDEHFLNKEYEKAAIYFKAAYLVPGPTRVLSGFKLIDTYDALNWADSALGILADMEKKYLVGYREFREAKRLRQMLEEKKRKGLLHKKIEPMIGREWLLQVSAWRLHWVLGAMDELRKHGIPLKESAQGYVFLLEEYFLAHPTLPAQDATQALADFVYERDEDSRLPIHRWRMNPEATVTEEAKAFEMAPNKLTGAEWITMTHDDKMQYIQEAMETLKNQHVPMQKDVYAYTDALDKLFTEEPELPAYDSVVALASLLRDTEPQAAAILEALRLE